MCQKGEKMNKLFLSFVLGMLYTCLLDLIVQPIRIKCRKQANYDCSKCKVWDCPRKRCIYLKEKKDGKV